MNALRLFVITTALLLSAGCSEGLPFDNGDGDGNRSPGLQEPAPTPPTQRPAVQRCGGSAILSECKGAVPPLET
jgi:hypothetical protein